MSFTSLTEVSFDTVIMEVSPVMAFFTLIYIFHIVLMTPSEKNSLLMNKIIIVGTKKANTRLTSLKRAHKLKVRQVQLLLFVKMIFPPPCFSKLAPNVRSSMIGAGSNNAAII